MEDDRSGGTDRDKESMGGNKGDRGQSEVGE